MSGAGDRPGTLIGTVVGMVAALLAGLIPRYTIASLLALAVGLVDGLGTSRLRGCREAGIEALIGNDLTDGR